MLHLAEPRRRYPPPSAANSAFSAAQSHARTSPRLHSNPYSKNIQVLLLHNKTYKSFGLNLKSYLISVHFPHQLLEQLKVVFLKDRIG